MKTLILSIMLMTMVSCDDKELTAYRQKLYDTKKYYPFDKWQENFNHGLTQYTPANCNKAKAIFDILIDNLVTLGDKATEDEKIKVFQEAIEATNSLNDSLDGTLIETGEREELCELTNQISLACDIDPKKYGHGEGLASEWRDW